MVKRLVLTALLVSTLASTVSAEVPTTTCNLTLWNREISSVGHAALEDPECWTCGLWGVHRLEGGFAENTFGSPNPSGPGPTEGPFTRNYDGKVEQATIPSQCYWGYIQAESLSGLGKYRTPDPKCEPPICTLSLTVSGHGSVSGTAPGTYTCGINVSLTAQPDPGYNFAGWTGSITSSGAELGFVLDASKQLTATFEASPPPDPVVLCTSWTIDPNCTNSPIIVRLEGGSYELSGLDDPVLFDFRAEGSPIRSGWTSEGGSVAFLALDRNLNGLIDSGAELFGDATRLQNGQYAANGFLALAEFDLNGDGAINAHDPVWANLLLWTDGNHNAITDTGEARPLSETEATEISLTAHWTGRRDKHGNLFRYQGAMKFGSQVRPIYDVWFVASPN